MPERDLVFVVILDLLAVIALASLVIRVLRTGRTRSAPVPRAGVLLATVAAALLLVALPLPWARAAGKGDGLATLTASPASSLVELVAIVSSIAALGMGAYLGLRSVSLVVSITGFVLGAGWCLVALNSLLLISGIDRAAIGGHQLTAGPAIWLCLLGGLVAVAAAEIATRSSAPLAMGTPAVPQARADVDEWGMPGPPVATDTGDQW